MKPADSGVDQHVLLKSKPKSDETRAFLTFSSSGDDIDSRSSITSVEQGELKIVCVGARYRDACTAFLNFEISSLIVRIL